MNLILILLHSLHSQDQFFQPQNLHFYIDPSKFSLKNNKQHQQQKFQKMNVNMMIFLKIVFDYSFALLFFQPEHNFLQYHFVSFYLQNHLVNQPNYFYYYTLYYNQQHQNLKGMNNVNDLDLY